MRTELEVVLVKYFEEQQKAERLSKLRYADSHSMRAYYEGREYVLRDIALQIRQGDFPPLNAKGGG